jgi:hypothetical protein
MTTAQACCSRAICDEFCRINRGAGKGEQGNSRSPDDYGRPAARRRRRVDGLCAWVRAVLDEVRENMLRSPLLVRAKGLNACGAVPKGSYRIPIVLAD